MATIAAGPIRADPVPGFIKRNTVWIAVSQVFGGAGQQFSASLGSLMLVSLLGSSTLLGVPLALSGVSRFVSGYPFGRITDRHGRRLGFLLGLLFTFIGAGIVGVSMLGRSFPGFVVGLLVFGMGTNGIQQLRLAAAEMYPPARRALVLGYVLTGSFAGVVVTPSLVALGEWLAPRLAVDPLVVPWLLLPFLLVPAAALIWQVRPDPRTIAADLQRYYPSYRPESEGAALGTGFGLREFWQDPSRRVAAVAMFAAQGSMSASMVTTPLGLAHHGAALAAIGLSISLHIAGMYGPSLPLGALVDRVGRRPVLIGGTILEAIGGGVTAFSSTQVLVTVGIVLVGIGWCAANVSSTAIVIDSTPSAARGRAIGIIDSVAAASVIFPLAVGPLVEAFGIGASGILAVALLIPPSLIFILSGATLAIAPTLVPAGGAGVETTAE